MVIEQCELLLSFFLAALSEDKGVRLDLIVSHIEAKTDDSHEQLIDCCHVASALRLDQSIKDLFLEADPIEDVTADQSQQNLEMRVQDSVADVQRKEILY